MPVLCLNDDCRFLLVEDTYGVEFHRHIVEELINRNVIAGFKPRIERIPAGLCNQALYRKVLAKVFNCSIWRVLFLIDIEDRDINEAEASVKSHFKQEYCPNIRIIAIHPKHEAWLCIGIGLNKQKCRADSISEIQRSRNLVYDKHLLADLAGQINIDNLLLENDFREYVNSLIWLTE